MTDAAKLALVLPNYEIGGELGRGGFGVVVAGRHRQLGRSVAIKELPSALAADAGVRSRFVTEARVLASLDHPHIVPVYDYVEQDGLCLLVMESLPGGTVWESFIANGYTAETACAVVMVACAGLDYAHRKGVLHRDVKPENLLFTESGLMKVTDFGIAKVIGGSDALATIAGDILGTPAYMAPEQAEGKDLGPPADIYAAGVMLYELLSGRLPFSEEGGGIAIVYRHVFEEPVPLLDVAPHVPPVLAAVVMKALARSPADRYTTAEDFGVAIGEAATSVFGVGWLQRADVPVMTGGPILASTERATAPAEGPPAPRPPSAPVPTGARETVVVSAPPEMTTGAKRVTAVPPTAPVAAPAVPSQRVRPSTALRSGGAASSNISVDALVPVRQVLDLPPWPAPFALVTAALFALAVVLAFVGVGSPDRADTLPGTATVVGSALTVDGSVPLDLARKNEVRLSGLSGPAARADAVVLRLELAGRGFADSTRARLQRAGTGDLVAQVDARASRYLAAGVLDASVVAFAGDREVGVQPFRAEIERPFYTSVPGVLAIAALLFLLAYTESLLRPLRRRGRRRLSSLVGMVPVGAALGALATVFACLLKATPVSVTSAVVCAVLAAGGGLALALTTAQAGRRARLRRVARKRELAATTR